MGQWDDFTKTLAGDNLQAFVTLLVPHARFIERLDKELKQQRTIHADLLLKVYFYGIVVILHIEFQRRRDKDMGKRLWKYNTWATDTYDCPVYSFVVYLKPGGKIVEPPYIRKFPPDEVVHIFHFKNIKLWEWPQNLLLQPGLEVFLPLLPLMKDSNRREVVDDMIERLQEADKTDLLTMAYSFAALAFNNKADKEWLRRRFAMLKDILQESWAYREMVRDAKKKAKKEGKAEGKVEGRLETLRSMLVRTTSKRFPALAVQAEQVSQSISDSAILQQLFDSMIDAQTEDEARKALVQAMS